MIVRRIGLVWPCDRELPSTPQRHEAESEAEGRADDGDRNHPNFEHLPDASDDHLT